MPDTTVVPEGPHRALLAELFGLYHRAGTPSARTVAAWVGRPPGHRQPGGDTISHSTVSKILNGSQRPSTTRQLMLLVHALTEHGPDGQPADPALVARFTQLWAAMHGPPSPGPNPNPYPDPTTKPDPAVGLPATAASRPGPARPGPSRPGPSRPGPSRRAARQQLRHAGPELRALLTYLLWTLAKRADLAAVYRHIATERELTGDPRLSVYEKLQTFREKWQDAWHGAVVPPWDRLVQPWALAYGGESGLAEAERLYTAIGLAEAHGPAPARPGDPGPSAGHPLLDEYLTQITGTLATVADRGSDLFVDAVLPRLRELAREIRPWRDGVVRAMDANYETMLVRAYERAGTVRAATVPEFLPYWQGTFGAQLVAAHRVGRARTVRVFVFDSAGQAVQPEVRRILFAQVLMRATVYVFARADAPRVAPPRARTWDFAVIDDGAVIAETIIDAGSVGATWYFANADAIADYREFFDRLTMHSVEYGQFLQQQEPGRDLPGLLEDMAALLHAFGESDRALAVLAALRSLRDRDRDRDHDPDHDPDHARGSGEGGHIATAGDLAAVRALCSAPGTLPASLPALANAVSAQSVYLSLRGQLQHLSGADD